ncbi:MAG: hypothetical protein ACOX45_04465 [Acutalibacteraceae bacterium]
MRKAAYFLLWYTASRKPDTALMSLLSVALSSVSVKREHYTIVSAIEL